MATVTLWLSIASGGRVRSSGVRRAVGGAPPAPRRSRGRAGKGWRMEAPLSQSIHLPHFDYGNPAAKMREENRLHKWSVANRKVGSLPASGGTDSLFQQGQARLRQPWHLWFFAALFVCHGCLSRAVPHFR